MDCPGGLYLGEALEDLCTSPGRGQLQAWEDGLETHEVGMDVTHTFSLGSENMGNNSTDGCVQAAPRSRQYPVEPL